MSDDEESCEQCEEGCEVCDAGTDICTQCFSGVSSSGEPSDLACDHAMDEEGVSGSDTGTHYVLAGYPFYGLPIDDLDNVCEDGFGISMDNNPITTQAAGHIAFCEACRGDCEKCTYIQSYNTADRPYTCTKCPDNKRTYMSEIDTLCEWDVPDNCDDSTEHICNECEVGYYLDSDENECLECPTGCATCHPKTELGDTYMTCDTCLEHSDDGDDSNDYWLAHRAKDGVPQKERDLCLPDQMLQPEVKNRRDLRNCSLPLEDGCHECYSGFFWSQEESECQPCLSEISNCQKCSHYGDECLECFDDFELNELGFCHQPHCEINGCKRCSENGYDCLECKSGLTYTEGQCLLVCASDEFMSEGRCKKCSDKVPNCDSCHNSDQGFSCESCRGELTFVLKDDELTCGCDHVSFALNEICELCSAHIPNCAQCLDGQKCQECSMGYYPTPEGKCSSDPCGLRDEYGACL